MREIKGKRTDHEIEGDQKFLTQLLNESIRLALPCIQLPKLDGFDLALDIEIYTSVTVAVVCVQVISVVLAIHQCMHFRVGQRGYTRSGGVELSIFSIPNINTLILLVRLYIRVVHLHSFEFCFDRC